MPETPQLAPLNVEEQSFYWAPSSMTELITRSLKESPDTIWRKLIHDLTLSVTNRNLWPQVRAGRSSYCRFKFPWTSCSALLSWKQTIHLLPAEPLMRSCQFSPQPLNTRLQTAPAQAGGCGLMKLCFDLFIYHNLIFMWTPLLYTKDTCKGHGRKNKQTWETKKKKDAPSRDPAKTKNSRPCASTPIPTQQCPSGRWKDGRETASKSCL